MRIPAILVLFFLLFTGCTKDSNDSTSHQLLGLEGTITVYHTLPGIPSRNSTVSVILNGVHMTSGITNSNGKVNLNVSHIVSSNSINDFPAHVDIYAQFNEDPAVNASGKAKISYTQTGTDGSVKKYIGDFSVYVTIKEAP